MIFEHVEEGDGVVVFAFAEKRTQIIFENIENVFFDFTVSCPHVHFEVVLESRLLQFFDLHFQVVAARSLHIFQLIILSFIKITQN